MRRFESKIFEQDKKEVAKSKSPESRQSSGKKTNKSHTDKKGDNN
jgi:hypothetical protein